MRQLKRTTLTQFLAICTGFDHGEQTTDIKKAALGRQARKTRNSPLRS